MTTVTLFNTNALPLQVSVNNGQPFSLGAAGSNWVPQAPSSGAPSWSNTSTGQNVLGPGQNFLTLTAQGQSMPTMLNIAIPASIRWMSVQLYLSFNSYGDVCWVLLNQGQFVTGNIQLSSNS